jgi:HNH endonuclease
MQPRKNASFYSIRKYNATMHIQESFQRKNNPRGKDKNNMRQNFTDSIKKAIIERQGGLCAMCGAPIATLTTTGLFQGEAHHIIPDSHGGLPSFENCVYLCRGDHMLIGHGCATFGIDKQGGSTKHMVSILESRNGKKQRPETVFPYWNGEPKR